MGLHLDAGPGPAVTSDTQAQPLAPTRAEKRENAITLNLSKDPPSITRSNIQATPPQKGREKKKQKDPIKQLVTSAPQTGKDEDNTTTAPPPSVLERRRAESHDTETWSFVQPILVDRGNALRMIAIDVATCVAHYVKRQAATHLIPPILVLVLGLVALHFLEPWIPFHVRPAIDSVTHTCCAIVPLSSFCPIFVCASWNLVHLFPSVCDDAQFHSAGRAFSDNFATSHQGLARIVAHTNTVHNAPKSLLHHRTQMYEILQRLPEESYEIRDNIHTFLNQTQGLPVSLQHFIYEIQGIGTLAVRQYGFTKDLVTTVRNAAVPSRFVRPLTWLRITPSEEETVRGRLLEHTRITLEAVRAGIESATQQLFLHNALTATTSNIKISAMKDKRHSWKLKAEIMARYDILVRLGAQYGLMKESATRTDVNQNLEAADEVLTWSINMKQWLNLTLPGLQDTEAGLTFLQQNLLQQNEMIRFNRLEQSGKEYILDEFLGSFDNGIQLLLSSTGAWQHLRRDRYI